jgi:hypothetical protein
VLDKLADDPPCLFDRARLLRSDGATIHRAV